MKSPLFHVMNDTEIWEKGLCCLHKLMSKSLLMMLKMGHDLQGVAVKNSRHFRYVPKFEMIFDGKTLIFACN